MINGIWTVARWDLTQRIRSRRLLNGWIFWVVALTCLAGLIASIYHSEMSAFQGDDWGRQAGPSIFGLVVLLMLAFSLVIVPIFSASAIVSERESATLATLQATTLTAGQIVGGKLASACAVAGIFMAGGIPALGIAVGIGHISWWRAAVCLLVMYASMVLLCAIALGWSAIASRALVSTVLTYLTVFTLTVVLLIIFAFLSLTTTSQVVRSYWTLTQEQTDAYAATLDAYYDAHIFDDGSTPPAPPLDQCSLQTDDHQSTIAHTDRYWWLLVADPFVIVSDAAPLPPEARADIQRYMDIATFDPLVWIAYLVRSARLGGATTRNSCFTGETSFVGMGYNNRYYQVVPNNDGSFTISQSLSSNSNDTRTTAVVPRPPSPVPPRPVTMDTPLWPIGLGVNLLIAALFFWIAVRRVRVPYGQLPKGQRVA